MKYLFLLLPFFANSQIVKSDSIIYFKDNPILITGDFLKKDGDSLSFFMPVFEEDFQPIIIDTFPAILLCSMGESVFIINGYSVREFIDRKFHFTKFYLDADKNRITDIIVWMSHDRY